MQGCDDVLETMRRPEPDQGIADRLASGAIPSVATPGYAEAAEEKRSYRRLAAKVVALAAVAILGASSTAAATGLLPGAAQSTASDTFPDVGASVSSPARDGKGSGATGSEADPPAHNSDPALGNAHADYHSCTSEGVSAGHAKAGATVRATATTCATVADPSRHRRDTPRPSVRRATPATEGVSPRRVPVRRASPAAETVPPREVLARRENPAATASAPRAPPEAGRSRPTASR